MLSQVWVGNSKFDSNILNLSFNYNFVAEQNNLVIGKEVYKNKVIKAKSSIKTNEGEVKGEAVVLYRGN